MKKLTRSPVQLTITTEAKGLKETFGISKERAKELAQVSKDAVDISQGKISGILFEISKHCKNPNELAVSSFIAGQAIADAKRKTAEGALGILGDLLQDMNKNKKS